jgi:hypothetical protein
MKTFTAKSMKTNFTSSFLRILVVYCVSLLFINSGIAQERKLKESDHWPTTSKYPEEALRDYKQLLEKRAVIYNQKKAHQSHIGQRGSETSPVGTCNIIT